MPLVTIIAYMILFLTVDGSESCRSYTRYGRSLHTGGQSHQYHRERALPTLIKHVTWYFQMTIYIDGVSPVELLFEQTVRFGIFQMQMHLHKREFLCMSYSQLNQLFSGLLNVFIFILSEKCALNCNAVSILRTDDSKTKISKMAKQKFVAYIATFHTVIIPGS